MVKPAKREKALPMSAEMSLPSVKPPVTVPLVRPVTPVSVAPNLFRFTAAMTKTNAPAVRSAKPTPANVRAVPTKSNVKLTVTVLKVRLVVQANVLFVLPRYTAVKSLVVLRSRFAPRKMALKAPVPAPAVPPTANVENPPVFNKVHSVPVLIPIAMPTAFVALKSRP